MKGKVQGKWTEKDREPIPRWIHLIKLQHFKWIKMDWLNGLTEWNWNSHLSLMHWSKHRYWFYNSWIQVRNIAKLIQQSRSKFGKVSTETQVSQLWALSLYRLVISVPDPFISIVRATSMAFTDSQKGTGAENWKEQEAQVKIARGARSIYVPYNKGFLLSSTCIMSMIDSDASNMSNIGFRVSYSHSKLLTSHFCLIILDHMTRRLMWHRYLRHVPQKHGWRWAHLD